VDPAHFGALSNDQLIGVDRDTVVEMKKTEGSIWEGRLTSWLARDDPQTLRVWISASFEQRVVRAMRRDGLDRSSAERVIVQRDTEEATLFSRLYGVDTDSLHKCCHIAFDSSGMSASTIAGAIGRVLAEEADDVVP